MRTSWVGLSITTNENKLGLNLCNIWWVGPVCLLIHLYPDIQTVYAYIFLFLQLRTPFIGPGDQCRRWYFLTKTIFLHISGTLLYTKSDVDVDILIQDNLLTRFGHSFTHKVRRRRRYSYPRQSSNTFWALFYTQSPTSTSIFLTKAIF